LECRPTGEVDLHGIDMQTLEKIFAAGELLPFVVGAKCRF
jgi:hypothetical protein